MKLNNKGWGLGVFIIFLGIFVMFLIVISILSNNQIEYNKKINDKETEINEIQGVN